MNKKQVTQSLAGCIGALVLTGGTAMANDDDDAMIENALSAAPAAVAEHATVIAIDDAGEMRVLREGDNHFTCMADNPVSPGNDPMCLDANGMQWAEAWMGKTEPPADTIGFGYMLQGGSDASNTDPHGAPPSADEDWVATGPHVMIFNYGTTMSGYPDPGDDPDTSVPYVMWGGTPYAHLMIPTAE